ncbi:MAG TPA: BamA/TamA family outer membrane protein [Candidatus Babeliales bacterium]|nr:BamA/TamA family outer membrane protein [Candidatus Babeliales bacterium]
MLYCRVLFFNSIIFFFVALSAQSDFDVTVVRSGDLLFQELEEKFPEKLKVESITYESDVFFSQNEFDYLVDIKSGTDLSLMQVKRALSYLKKKNKFETIDLFFQNVDRTSFRIHFKLVGFWTFHKVKFDGVFFGKEAYRHLYGMEQGEQFDIQRHHHFINIIKEALVADGYINATVSSYHTYDHRSKLVTPTVSIVPGAPFTIEALSIKFDQEAVDDEHRMMAHKIEERCAKKLLRAVCSQQLLNNETQKIREYLAKKGYLNPRIELRKTIDTDSCTINLAFHLNVANQRRFIFFGNQFFSKKELIDHCLSFGRAADMVPLSIISEEIIERYHSKGFWEVRIEIEQENNKYFFLVNEGPRAQICSIIVRGLTSIDETWLSKKFFKAYKKKKHVDLESLKNQIAQLLKWYHQQGFVDAKIEREQFVPAANAHEYILELTVYEGNHKTIEKIAIEGVCNDDEEYAAVLLHKESKNDLFTFDKLNDHKKTLLNYFQSRGYLYAQLKAEILQNNECVEIIWHVSPGKRFKFGKTILQGATHLPFSLIEKNLSYHDGDWWNKERVRESFLKLRDLDVFETIYAHGDSSQECDNEKAVILKLVHDDPYEVRVRAGFQQVSRNFAFRNGTTYKLGGSLLIKNPFNYADSMRLDIDVTRFYRNVSGIYKRPWFLGFPINLILKGYNSTYMQPIILGSAKPLYQARQQGGLIGLSYKADKREWGINAGFELLETNHLSVDLARAINFEPVLIDKKAPYAYIEPNLFIDELDNKANPRFGSLTVVSCKGMAPFNKNGVPFLKILLDQSLFFPVWHTIFGLHVRVGNIFAHHFATIMPIDRFYLGGEMSLRGYLPDFAPPLGVFIDEKGKECLVPQGGRFVFNANLEVRFPIPIMERLWGAIFEDIGILVSDAPLTAIDSNSLLGSTGFGLRYLTPIGPLRFDIGWKWRKRDPEENSYAAWFTLGHAF